MASNIGVTPDYILHQMTWENLILYGYATPTYDDDDWDDSIDANNPKLADKFSGGIVTNPFV